MSSNHDMSNTNSTQICRVCLATDDNMYEMNDSEIFTYRNIVPTSTFKVIFNYSEMYLCLYCRHLLRKVHRFTQQCLKAEEILSNTIQEDLKPLSNKFHNFTSTTIAHQFPEEDDEKSDSDDERDYDDIPLVMLKEEDAGSEVWKFEMEVKKKKKRVKDEKIEVTLKPIKAQAPQTDTSSGNQTKKRQKVVKEGFTSRMVQETDEYKVIKLSKEQVLEEMAQQSISEKYQRYLFKCESCVKGFNFEDVLLNHMQKHSPDAGSLKCEICTQYCPSAVSMRGHMKSHTTRYACKVCGIQRGSRQHLLEHYAIQHAGSSATYQCQQCPFTTNKRTVMQRHSRAHNLKDKLACHLCGELFKDLTTLRVHTVRHDKTRMFRCGSCPSSFAIPAMLRRHVAAAHQPTDLYCVECDITFKSQDNLRLHFKRAKRHRDPSSYKHECEHCSQRFVTPSALAGHLCAAHGVPKQHSCSVCGRSYSSRSAARAHIKAAHRDVTPGEDDCRVCARTFSRKSVLSAHERTHVVQRPVECGAHRATLRAHTALHRHQKEENSSIDATAQPVPNEG